MITTLLALLLSSPVEPPPLTAPSLPPKTADRHISIRAEITTEDLENYVRTVSAAMANDQKRVVITIDSPGGSVQVAHYIVKMMDVARQDQGIMTDCVVDGAAWSSALYILEACDHRYMTRRSTLVAHNPVIPNGFPVSLDELQNGSTQHSMEVVARAFAEHIASRMTVTIEQYLARVEGSRRWWMDWREALAMGAVDRVLRVETEVWTTEAEASSP